MEFTHQEKELGLCPRVSRDNFVHAPQRRHAWLCVRLLLDEWVSVWACSQPFAVQPSAAPEPEVVAATPPAPLPMSPDLKSSVARQVSRIPSLHLPRNVTMKDGSEGLSSPVHSKRATLHHALPLTPQSGGIPYGNSLLSPLTAGPRRGPEAVFTQIVLGRITAATTAAAAAGDIAVGIKVAELYAELCDWLDPAHIQITVATAVDALDRAFARRTRHVKKTLQYFAVGDQRSSSSGQDVDADGASRMS